VACGQSQIPDEAEVKIDSYQQSKADFDVESARLIAGKTYENVVNGYLRREPKAAAKSILPAALGLASPVPIVKLFTTFDNLFYIGVEFVGS
jgi:hypothetical protein